MYLQNLRLSVPGVKMTWVPSSVDKLPLRYVSLQSLIRSPNPDGEQKSAGGGAFKLARDTVWLAYNAGYLSANFRKGR